MLKKIMTIGVTVLILVSLSLGLSRHHHFDFLYYSCFVGVMVTTAIFFFTSTGEVKGRFLDVASLGRWGLKSGAENKEHSFTPSLPFFTSLVFTILSFAILFFK